MTGTILEIYTGNSGEALVAHASVEIEQDRGIVGDRYCEELGTFSERLKGNPKSQVTFIAIEEVEQFNREQETDYRVGEFRRNVVTRGIDLNQLVGREFEINGIRFLGIEPCQPCAHLAQLVDRNVLPHMIDRAGLRAQARSGGVIKSGAEIEVVKAE